MLEGTKSTRTWRGKAECPDGRNDLRQGAEAGTNKLHSGNSNQGLWECKGSPRGVRREERGWLESECWGRWRGLGVPGGGVIQEAKRKTFWNDYPGRWEGNMIQVVF